MNNYVNQYSLTHEKQPLTADVLSSLAENALLSHNSTELYIVAKAFNDLKEELGEDFNFTDIDLLHQIFKNQVANPDSSHIWAALFYCVEMVGLKRFIDGCGVHSTNPNTIKDALMFCTRGGVINDAYLSFSETINKQNYKLDNIKNALYHDLPVLCISNKNNTNVFVEVVEHGGAQQWSLVNLRDKIETFFNQNPEATLLDFFNKSVQVFETSKFNAIWNTVKTYENDMGRQLRNRTESMKQLFISYLARTTHYSLGFASFLDNDEEARQVYLNIPIAAIEAEKNLYPEFKCEMQK